MRVSQRLSSGLEVRQDFTKSVRFLMFETDVEGWVYATHGGTAFIVNVGNTPFGITSKHGLGDFNWRHLALTDLRFGRYIAGLKAIYYPSNPSGDAVESDVLDVAVVRFSDDVGVSFFQDAAYIVEPSTVTTSNVGDRLLVNGALKDQSSIDEGTITPVFGLLEFIDRGPTSDSAVREANAIFRDLTFERLTGLSGSPVFNATQEKLCGMMVRGGMTDGHARIRYIDFADITKVLEAIKSGTLQAQYNKTVARLVQPTSGEG